MSENEVTEQVPARTKKTEEERRAHRKEYNRKYYESMGQTLRERKIERYHSDPAYRDRVRSDSASRRKYVGVSSTVECGGAPVPAHRAAELASRVGVSISTINFWQKFQTIPDTPYRTPGGYRLYTDSMIEAVASALSAYPRPSRGDKLFAAFVTDAWRNVGVPLT